jgi:hypothetical protein
MPLSKTRFIFVICISLVVALGCSTEISTTANDPGREQTVQVGTGGILINIESDNVQAAGYDASTRIMTVQFDNGYLYDYYQVPPNLWLEFVAAQPNPWSLVGYPRLVQGGYAYQRTN